MIIRLDNIDSTNRYVLRELVQRTENKPVLTDNTLVVADSQHAGRGRQGKSWYSPAGKNIYASYLIMQPTFPIYISLWICGLASLKALRDIAPSLDLWLKWPNDIYCTPRDRPTCKLKIAGLLAETFSSATSNKIQAVVAGMGINLNMNADELQKIDRPATSLMLETGKNVNIAEFADSLLSNLLFFRELAETDTNKIYEQWRKENNLLNCDITLQQDNSSIVKGCVVDFSRRGELLLEIENGELLKIMTGELLEF